MNLGQNTFSNPFNIFDFLPSQRSLEMAKAESDAAAINQFGSDPNPIRRVPFNLLTGMGVNPTVAKGLPSLLDVAPVTGDASLIADAVIAAKEGDLPTAGLLSAMAILPVVPASKAKSLLKATDDTAPLLKVDDKADQIDNPLIVHHNLNEEAVKSIDRLGGLPSPSMAISKVDEPLMNFGEITLVGNPNMAKPSGLNDIFRADGYTTRRPHADTFMNSKAKKFVEDLGLNESYQDIDDIAEILYKGDEGTYSSQGLRKSYLKSIGENPDTYNHSSFDNFRSGYQDYIDRLGKDMIAAGGSGKEKIFIEYTDYGRKYLPATLKNYVKIMKKKRGAGMESTHHTMGSIRAKLSPQFKNISEIKAERDKVVSRENFEEIKNQVELDYDSLMTLLSKKLPDSVGYRTADEMFEDIMLDRLGSHPYSAPYEKYIDNEVYELAAEVREKLINMPTEYFEIKPQRGVQLGEFEGAILPAETKKETIEILKNNGVKNIHKYKSDEERKDLFKKFGNVFFTTAGTGVGVTALANTDITQ
jgi:hypothetical protein